MAHKGSLLSWTLHTTINGYRRQHGHFIKQSMVPTYTSKRRRFIPMGHLMCLSVRTCEVRAMRDKRSSLKQIPRDYETCVRCGESEPTDSRPSAIVYGDTNTQHVPPQFPSNVNKKNQRNKKITHASDGSPVFQFRSTVKSDECKMAHLNTNIERNGGNIQILLNY